MHMVNKKLVSGTEFNQRQSKMFLGKEHRDPDPVARHLSDYRSPKPHVWARAARQADTASETDHLSGSIKIYNSEDRNVECWSNKRRAQTEDCAYGRPFSSCCYCG